MARDKASHRDTILEHALSLDPEAAARFLEEACGTDASLRDELQRLLSLNRQMSTWSLDVSRAQLSGPSFHLGQWLSRYELIGIQGHGGMGVVYQARDSVIGRVVAVKVLTSAGRGEQLSARFLSELRNLGGIVHDNIVRVYDYGEADGWPYIVMELLEGEDLSHAIAGERCGDLRRKLGMARELAAALQHIHAAGIVHHDLKPANVFVESSSRIKLMDFGISKRNEPGFEGSAMLAGTPQYMAPEQLSGEPCGPAVDVYAFGVVLYELLTGQRPFTGGTFRELSRSILYWEPPAEPLKAAKLSAAVTGLIHRTLRKRPSDRPAGFHEILPEIDGLIRAAEAESLGRSSRWKLAVLVFTSVCLALFAGGAYYSRGPMQRNPVETSPAPSVTPPSAAVTSDPDRPQTRVPSPERKRPEERQPSRTQARESQAGVAPLQGPIVESTPAAPAPNPAPASDLPAPATNIGEAPKPAAVAEQQDTSKPELPKTAEHDPVGGLARDIEAGEQARREIMMLLERYTAAYRSKNTAEIAAIWPSLDAVRLRTIEVSFANAEEITFELYPDEPKFSDAGTATVVCRRRVAMIDRRGTKPQPVEGQIRIELKRNGNRWVIASID